MNSQELRALQEAYHQVYELDENRMASHMGKMPSGPAKVGKATHSIKDLTPSKPPSPEEKAKARKALGIGEAKQAFPHKKVDRQVYDAMDSGETAGDSGNAAKQKRDYDRADKMRSIAAKHGGKSRVREETDLFDYILEHLVAEGYADTNEAALAIMANMSEEWREDIVEGMTMKDFKANRRNIKRREASADAEKRGHVSKNIVTHGRKYSPDEAKSNRANMTDYERSARKSFNMNPDQVGNTDETADKTKNLKKLRKQKAMGEH